MNGLIITSLICWIIGFFINGFSLYNVLIIIPTLMFSVRKVGIHVKYGHIIAVECLLLFFSIAYRLMFHKFHIIRCLLGILVRIIFIIICIYDDIVYVYVSEERKRI